MQRIHECHLTTFYWGGEILKLTAPTFRIPNLASPTSPFHLTHPTSAPLESPKFAWHHQQTLDTYMILDLYLQLPWDKGNTDLEGHH